MIRARNVHILLALGALTALPACSDIMGNRSSGSSRSGSSGSSASAPAPQPVANEMVRKVQNRLQQDGYYKQGNVDGVWGTGTMNAVQAYQRDHNLSASGQLDVATLRSMNLPDTNSNAGSAAYNPNTPPYDPNAPAGTYNTTPTTGPANTGPVDTAPVNRPSNSPNRQP